MGTDLITDIFCQADIIKGWRYIDDAGKIMNKWDVDFPEKSVGIEGLIMRNKTAIFETLKVNPTTIWLHFSLPDNLDYAIDISKSTIETIADLLDVNQYRRIGMRVQYMVPCTKSNLAEVTKELGKNLYSPVWTEDNTIPEISPFNFEFMCKVANEPIQAILRVHIVRKAVDFTITRNIPDYGILLDIDLFRTGPINKADIGGNLKRFSQWISQELPTIRGKVLGGINLD